MTPTVFPQTAGDLFDLLDSLGIGHKTIDHPPLYTVEQSKQLRGDLPGAHVKNLFLRNKKGRMWLLTCLENRRFDLKSLRQHLGTSSLSFCSPERLMDYLGVIPGAVTPLAVVNDVDRVVQVVLDESLLDMDPLNFHPLDNSKTTSITATGLVKFLEATGHSPMLLNFECVAESNE